MLTLFEHICGELQLGSLTAEPQRLSGGYTHRMFSLTTAKERYAVKLLNPEIMQRPDAPANYRRAEEWEALLEARGLPILPAMTIGGCKMHCIDGQFLYVFPFYDGRVLSDAEITPAHCASMGNALARIHAVSRREAPDAPQASQPIRWQELTAALLADPEAHEIGLRMQAAAPMLRRITQAMEAASAALPREEALCHNDMDAKNVLWQGDDFRIIDLECLGCANPQQELLDLAISWAGRPADEQRFKAFMIAYREAGGVLSAAPADLYDSRRNDLDWLAYNARRALFDDPEEQRIGREQVAGTLGKIEGEQRKRNDILAWFECVR